MHSATSLIKTPHPARKNICWHTVPLYAFCGFRGYGRLTKITINLHGGFDLLNIRDNPPCRSPGPIAPFPGVPDHQQILRATDDSTHGTVTQQVGKPHRYQTLITHSAFNNPVSSTLRIDCKVDHTPTIRSSWLYNNLSTERSSAGA